MDVLEQFIGIWNLLQWTTKQGNGEIVYPYGKEVIGQIWNDATGHMMVQIMKEKRKLFGSNNFLLGTAEETLSAYNGFVAYCGTYSLDVIANQVIHHLQICSFPNWVGHIPLNNTKIQFVAEKISSL